MRENEKLKDKSSARQFIMSIKFVVRTYEAPARYFLRNLKSDRRMWTPTMIDDARLLALSIYTVYLYITSETSRKSPRTRSESIADERGAQSIRDAIDQSRASEIVARDLM